MSQKVLRFTGINRKINEFQGSGACEELINLRPQNGGGYHIVREKHAIEENAQWYNQFYEHKFGDVDNKIIVHEREGVVWINPEAGTTTNITSEFVGKDVSISSAGNVLMIYCEEEKRQLVFKFEDGKYSEYGAAIKRITDVSILYTLLATLPPTNTATADAGTAGALNEALLSAASGFHKNYPHGLCGAAVVGCTYELNDGSELWSTAFVVANPSLCNGYSAPVIDADNNKVTVTGASHVSLRLVMEDVDAGDVKRINIYATRPVLPYEISNAGTSPYVNELSLDDASLGGQLMYYQGSVSPEGTLATFALSFGAEQVGEKVMEVTQGCIERAGEAVSYNNRFHFYRSEVRHVLQPPTISDFSPARDSATYWAAYVKINDKWKLIDKKYRISSTTPNDFIYPMAGVKRLAFVKGNWPDGGSFSVPYTDMFYVDLKDSTAYNYSYAFGVTPSLVDAGTFGDIMDEEGQAWGDGFDRAVFLKEETNAINVSAQYNPFVFPVEYSYSFGGEILDVVTSYIPISSTQVGQYPLTVFTSNGIFALEQGNGAVLYSNIVPLQPLVISGKATSTPHGTFFVSSKSLYLLSGREVANVSYVLNGGRELGIRELPAYKRLCFDAGGYFSNFSRLLSSVDFEEYISDVIMTYDQLNNELFISSTNEDLHYSYVLNLDTKSYHKISKKYLRTQNGSHNAIEVEGESRRVVDLHIEEDSVRPVLLQSRPLSLEVLFTHIQRLILFADATLGKGQNLCLSVFGSDNLYDWKCIISSQKQNVSFRQIRTNRAAKSYRDYVILVTGTVGTETDISEIIADYTVVQRRLG